ncbi:MAG: isoprenyl transferase [Candidatus Latescibacteria bacterium]|nr:isoprenyl transferase [Candidatus Latescibacterota bacterium]NIM22142.1 isoprenyl transferase [Candidatus Latescibacterota bacterium]NIM64692.1 isoprenyl transferase [Candidatus Latescibacterota bacterium]NIO01202.1 isoprenyl transferase [Candidatus Latescibacterota bacterium]NIO27587.1 isoprenyl transferase [Candidatus Latescibacterota bacterium]
MTQNIDEQIEKLRASANLPNHVAIIMDGNGRWAKKRRLPRLAGHRAGRESVKAVVRACARIGIKYLTLYAFSLENWQRPKSEVRGLMSFFEEVLEKEYLELDENGVQLRAMGRLELLPDTTRRELIDTIEKLRHNDRLILNLAISYGGRTEITDAVKRVVEDARKGVLNEAEIDAGLFKKYLYDPDMPDPDLLVRTSGEFRVSNFLLWQIAYTEIYVTDVLWPDFREKDLLDAVFAFQKRERRFGLIT